VIVRCPDSAESEPRVGDYTSELSKDSQQRRLGARHDLGIATTGGRAEGFAEMSHGVGVV
jgi:hypothetical protein